MKTLSDEEIEKYVDEIVMWKKQGDKDWEYINAHLHYIDIFNTLRDSDEETYKHYVPLFISNAKENIEKESARNGISTVHENWFYVDRVINNYQWKKCKEIMMNGWSEERIKTVTNQSSEIVNFLPNPSKLDTPVEQAIRKGLVYGNVQSGKTAHIAAIIAMYASAGCKMIIVLSGITKALRLQTQDRLRNDLGFDKYGCYDFITKDTDLIGKSEQRLEGKFNSDKPCIGVFKKSPSALKRLLSYCKSSNDLHFWNGRQVLIIDDESDQYSINVKTMKDEENGDVFDRSTINGLIVKLLCTFERYCYIGFTATPFANVLNELPGKDSLYPSNFIYPLKIDKKYYGAAKLFGSARQDPEKPLTVMNAINVVKETEISPKLNDFSQMPESLQDAVNYFIVATACKYYRGIEGHSSMLVHLDMKIAVHEQLGRVLNDYKGYVLKNYKKLEAVFKNIWEIEKKKINFSTVKYLFDYSDSEECKYKLPEYKSLVLHINTVLNKLQVVVDNSAHPLEERLNYSKDKNMVVIAIGGNTLSRGLTLEGLLVSYFHRTSSMYDTLLQMGRWFGYRIGYEDLARLYTTKKIAFRFSELADVEEELREQCSNYDFEITPAEMSLRIRTLPSLQITRKMAMQNAVSTGVNYSGQRAETLFFPRLDSKWLLHNQKCTAEFIDSLNQKPERKNNQWLYSNIDIKQLRQYIKNINIHSDNKMCNKELLLKYLDKAENKKYLLKWNVVVISNKTGDSFPIAKSLTVNLIERSRYDLKDPTDERAYLKVLQQPNNLLLDTDICSTTPANTNIRDKFNLRHLYFKNKGIEEPGLMVIYPINKNSHGRNKSDDRLPLDACENIIGNMFVFPMNNDVELAKYMTIDLKGELS